MELLEQRILRDGKVKPGGILKVDSFLNHQLDPMLMHEMAKELHRLFDGQGVNKILTIEASGIALAIMTGLEFGCPVVFAKKSKSKNISDKPSDRILITDDFLATGAALIGLRDLSEQAGASVVGAGIAIEKAFQGGGDHMRAEGMRVESLAKIASMSDDGLVFCR